MRPSLAPASWPRRPERAGAGAALAAALLPLVGGCPYVSRAEIEPQLELRDDDGDGVTVSAGDCDDLDAAVFPGADEVPYDNVDNDCADGDLRDVDGDGHDGCLVQDGACVDGAAPDCDDADPTRFPGAEDLPYDGIDSDCRGDHDYDLDSDGFTVAGADEDTVAAYEAASGLSAQRGDCVDTNRTVYPGAPGEEPYDGVDTDCDGANDFDADGDGYVAPEDDSPLGVAALERYLEQNGEPLPTEAELDCDDADPDVNPGATEIWYDGVDGDCDGADDDDQDGDGYPLDEDCSDDPTVDPDAASRSPETHETLSNTIDDDCFGGDDARWAGVDTIWTNPASLRVVHVGNRFVLAALLDAYTSPFAMVTTPGLGLLNFDDQGPVAPASDERLFHTQQVVAGSGLSLLPVGSDLEVGFVVIDTATTTYRYTMSAVGPKQTWSSLPDLRRVQAVELTPTVLDLGSAWSWACGDGQFLAYDWVFDQPARIDLPSEPLTCFAEATDGEATVCVDGGCQTFRADAGTLVPVSGREGFHITEALRTGDVWTFIDDGTLVVEGADVPPESAEHAAFTVDDGEVYGVLDGPGGLELLHGPEGGPLARIPLDPGIEGAVAELGIAASDERVFVAVRTDADEMRWAVWVR